MQEKKEPCGKKKCSAVWVYNKVKSLIRGSHSDTNNSRNIVRQHFVLYCMSFLFCDLEIHATEKNVYTGDSVRDSKVWQKGRQWTTEGQRKHVRARLVLPGNNTTRCTFGQKLWGQFVIALELPSNISCYTHCNPVLHHRRLWQRK